MPGPPRVSRIELLGALSLATDLGTGQPLEHGLRTCLLATTLAEAAELPTAAQADVYVAALLHSIGCTADGHEAAALFGDDVELRLAYSTVDGGDAREVLAFLVRQAGRGQPSLRRVSSLLRVLAAGSEGPRAGFQAHCEVGQRLAERLRLPDGARQALGFVFERWDGKGYPNGAGGSDTPLAARILHVARDAIVYARRDGARAGCDTLRERARHAYDADIVALLTPEMVSAAQNATWEDVTCLDCAPSGAIVADQLEDAFAAVADFADIKSPWTLGHSHDVADLTEGACWRLGLDAGDVALVRGAALVHDLGRVAISSSFWDKPGPLTSSEWERVRLHPYFTERALGRAPGLTELALLAGAHHERRGGGGYHRGIDAGQLPIGARVLAASDVLCAMCADRPHRPAVPPDAAAAELRAMTLGAAALDREAVEAVLGAAGHAAEPVERALPAGLSAREVEVLVRLARGQANKAIAAELGITPKTVGHHVSHIYAKIGVSTRAAAALFAVEHELLTQRAPATVRGDARTALAPNRANAR